jgi:hypothetical protein
VIVTAVGHFHFARSDEVKTTANIALVEHDVLRREAKKLHGLGNGGYDVGISLREDARCHQLHLHITTQRRTLPVVIRHHLNRSGSRVRHRRRDSAGNAIDHFANAKQTAAC